MSNAIIMLLGGGVWVAMLLAVLSWEREVRQLRYSGPGYDDLGAWLEGNVPDLYWRLSSMQLDDQRKFLNELTGLQILSSDLIDESSGKFLLEIKKMKDEGRLQY